MAYPYFPNYSSWGANAPVNNPITSPSNDIVWVQGENDAKARPVIAGHSALFMDSENTCFYIKTVDASGIPQPLRVFDYKERTQVGTDRGQSGDRSGTNAVTREEFDALVKKVEGLIQGEGEG